MLTQAIPPGMAYVLNSATTVANRSAQLIYSIDGGHTFMAAPTVQVIVNGQSVSRSAPAEVYTHVRWTLISAIAPGETVNVAYQVKVR